MAGYNAPGDAGFEQAAAASLSLGDPEAPHRVRVTDRIAGGALGGTFTYSRVDLAARTALRAWRANRLWLAGTFVHVAGSAPRQQLADAGGLSTVRGFGRRTALGRRAAAFRAEYPVPWDLFRVSRLPLLRALRIQFVPWVDWAQTWRGSRERSR